MITRKVIFAIFTIALFAVTGCKSAQKRTTPATPAAASKEAKSGATVQIEPKSGSKVSGTLALTDTPKGLHVTGNLTGLTPGKHGIHIHEKADCSAADASSAGGHYMVGAQTHGAPKKATSHAGDLGNIKANKKGEAKIDDTFPGLTVASVMDHSIVVHAKKDDYKTQPSGASGDRVGCGEVK